MKKPITVPQKRILRIFYLFYFLVSSSIVYYTKSEILVSQESRQFSFDPALEEFYDYEKYGEERMTHEEGRFIEQGYISYHGSMTLDELMRDDPAEQEQQMGGMG